MAFASDAQRRWWFAQLAHGGGTNTRAAANIKDADAFFGDTDEEWAKRLTFDEREFLDEYINMEYQRVSSYLRGRMGPLDSPANRSSKSLVDRLDAIFRNAPTLPDDLTVYRGVSQGFHGDVGDVVSDAAFQSTSLDLNTAKRFSRDGGTLARIIAPGGTRYIPLGAMDPRRGTGEAEFELLFPRQAKYRIKKITSGQDGRRYVDLEMRH